MKKILITTRDFHVGGVQKSLINFLKALKSDVESGELLIDLFVLNDCGELKNEIPEEVNIIKANKSFLKFGCAQSEAKKMKVFIQRSFCAIWTKCFTNAIPLKHCLKKEQILKGYDIAISYATTISNRSMYAGWSEFIINNCDAKKKIVYIHNDFRKSALNNDYTINLLRKFDKVWFVSKNCEIDFETNIKGFKGKTDTIPNIIDVSVVQELSNATDTILRSDCVNLISVSRLSQEKGHLRTLDVLSKLKEEGYIFKWHVLGDGPMKDKIKEKIKNLGMTDRVILYGNQSNPYSYIKNADMLMLNSFNESYGLVLIDAMLLNVPVFTTETITAKEIVGKYGFVCYNNSDGIYSELKKVLDHPSFLEEKKNLLKNYHFNNMDTIKKIKRYIYGK